VIGTQRAYPCRKLLPYVRFWPHRDISESPLPEPDRRTLRRTATPTGQLQQK
jgi:hypothetical protein